MALDDLSNFDLRNEMIEDLRAGGNALEEHGYVVDQYNTMAARDPEVHVSASDPEEALDLFLTRMENRNVIEAVLWTDTLLDVFQHGYEPDMEDAVNQVLYQIEGWIQPRDPELDDVHPFYDIEVSYHPDIEGGRYRIFPPGKDLEPYAREFEEIFKEEGIRVEIQ